MAHRRTVLGQLLKLVPRYEFETQVNTEQPHELYEALFGRLLRRCQGKARTRLPVQAQVALPGRHPP